MQSSIISYPNRGPWGDNKWRGNASGHVYKDLFEQLKPKVFTDPMQGSGTSIEVAREMNIEAYGRDLSSGFNAINDSILDSVGKESDLVVSHPPYGAMIVYSGNVWGNQAHPDDLSRCIDDADFHEKMQLVLLNQRMATRANGFYGTLIGDWRRGGVYTSYQAELIARMPKDELAAVIIKTQHNCVSDSKVYANLKFPRIVHEYLILWQKKTAPVMVLLQKMAQEHAARLAGTWKNIVRMVVMAIGKSATLESIYKMVERDAPDRLVNNPNWKAKIRQVLNQNRDLFQSVYRGVWALA